MKKAILQAMSFAATAALVIIGCGDNSVQNKSAEITDLLSVFTGAGAYYTLTVNVTPGNGGAVSRNPSNTRYKAGSDVAVTAAAARGYIFTGWSGASNDTAATVAITMTGDLTLTANFASQSAPAYILSVNVTPKEGGNVTRDPNKTRYNAGEEVAVTADALDGYTFTGWSGASNDLDPTVTITMNSDLTINANFQQHTYTLTLGANPAQGGTVSREPYKAGYAFGDRVTVTAAPATGYTFTGWSGASSSTNPSVTITIDNNLTLTALFERLTYTLTTKTSPTNGGTASRNPNKNTYNHGDQVTVTAAPATGYAFNGWTGSVTSTSAGVTVTMDGDKELTANFKTQTAPSYMLTTVPNHDIGSAITRNPDKASYQQGETVTVTAPTVNGYTFTGWSGAATSANSVVTITMDATKTLTANYKPIDYTLTVDVFPAAGGTVSRTPNNNTYTYNQTVTVSATPSTGYKFTGYSGVASSTNTNVTVTMDANKTLTATFEALTYTLETYVNQSFGGAVSRSPNKNLYTHNEQVTVTATPATGYTFTGWSGASMSTNASVNIVMDGNKTLTGNFQQTLYTLTTNASPTNGGTVSRNPYQTTYTPGTSVTVTATPAYGYEFKGWSGASSSTNATVTITMDGEKTLTALFGLPNAKRFTVYFNGNGTTGGNAPTAMTVDSGSTITLPNQQTMEKSGYSFDGWNTNNIGTGTQYAAFASYKVTGEVTLYAKWIPIHTVTFSGNGTTAGVPQTVTANSGANITLPAQGNMTRTGYSFGGWNTNSAGTGTQYAATSSYTVTGNVTIYAKWIPIYTVTFNGNGNTGGSVPETVSVDSGTVITLSGAGSLARTNYNFGGWNTNTGGTGTGYSAGASYIVTSNVTLYAKWTAYPRYTVTYNGNGNTSGSVPTATTVDSGSTITISGHGTLVKTGYSFDGWNTISDGTGTGYSVGLSYTVTGNVTLYAKWTAYPRYTVTYNGNGNTGGGVPTATTVDSSSTITLSGQGTMVKTGYNFGGWNTNSSGTGTNYSTEASYTVTGNVTLYAKWAALYTVTITSAGTSSSGGGNYVADAIVTINAGTPPSGQGFKYWTVTNGGVTLANPNNATTTFTMPANAVTVMAVFGALYTVTVTSTGTSSSGGGNYVADATVSINAGTPPSGQLFKNWTVTSGVVTLANPNNATTTFAMPANAVTVMAVFEFAFADGRDSKKYKTTVIGGKTWMAENLNYQPSSGNSWCYGNSADTCNKYGRLYDWNTAMAGSSSSSANPSGRRGVCPLGWHLPSRAEWDALVMTVGGYYSAGTKLKSSTGWNSSSAPIGTDEFGFSALPGGCYLPGSTIVYNDLCSTGHDGVWWTATESNSDNAYSPYMNNYQNMREEGSSGDKSVGCSVRCVRD